MNAREKSIDPPTPALVRIVVELSPQQAAGLKRFCDKTGFEDALDVLYPHVLRSIRSDQAHDILTALARIEKALGDCEVSSFPWIDTGRVL